MMGEIKRVYLDNAATTMQKPPCVVEAVTALTLLDMLMEE